MGSTFFLKKLPGQADLERVARSWPGLDPEAAEAYLRLLRLASDLLGAIDARMAKLGQSQGKLCVLMQLGLRTEGQASPSELADLIGVTRATVTGLVDGLERDGLAKRRRSDEDRRSQTVALTPKGRRLLETYLPPHWLRISKLMGRLSAQERKALVSAIAKLEAGVPEFGELG